eukprot:257493-Chlamydomonas_euryale.AAC.8
MLIGVQDSAASSSPTGPVGWPEDLEPANAVPFHHQSIPTRMRESALHWSCLSHLSDRPAAAGSALRVSGKHGSPLTQLASGGSRSVGDATVSATNDSSVLNNSRRSL